MRFKREGALRMVQKGSKRKREAEFQLPVFLIHILKEPESAHQIVVEIVV